MTDVATVFTIRIREPRYRASLKMLLSAPVVRDRNLAARLIGFMKS
jgi:hypothetical protein